MKITMEGFAVLDDTKDMYLSRWVEEQGRLCVEGSVYEHYLPLIQTGDVVVDAGAAIGDHTCAYLEKVGPTGVVHAFEPNPDMLECLAHNCPKAVIHPFGLSDRVADWFLDVGRENAGAGFLISHRDKHQRPVSTMTLDTLALPRLNFLKMDIEGMELFALRGAENTIRACRPTIVMEMNEPCLTRYNVTSGDIKEFLRRIGYSFRIFLGEEHNSHYELIATP